VPVEHDPTTLLDAAASLRADSDVAPLRRVLVHRPGSELARITAANADAFLFDGPVPVREAQREHDALVEALGSAGAEVDELELRLAEVVAEADVRAGLVEALCVRHEDAAAYLLELPPTRLARALIAGVADDELEPGARRAHSRWVVRPLPNLMFTRDLLAVVGERVARGGMRCPVRRAEQSLATAVLGSLGPHAMWPVDGGPLEGGDVVLLGDGVVVMGIGPRTCRTAALRLARRLLGEGAAREVIGALIPPDGPFHLDLAMTLVDERTLLVDRAAVDRMPAIRWRAQRPPVAAGDVVAAVAAAMGEPLTVIPTLPAAHGRMWDRGANVVALAPGTVVAYADNADTNRRLERAGVTVLGVPGAALGRGRGGPRCLTAPLLRTDAVS
jgi:arginine deiminase